MCGVEFDIVCDVLTRSRMFSRWMVFRFKMQVQNRADGFQVQKIGSKLIGINAGLELIGSESGRWISGSKVNFRNERFEFSRWISRFKCQVNNGLA